MILLPRWRRQLRGTEERTSFGLRAPDAAGISSQASAEVACVPQQAVGEVAFEVVPDLLGRIKLRSIGWELLQMHPGIPRAHHVDDGSLVNDATVPEEHDLSSQMPQQRPEELGHVNGLEAVRLPAEIQPYGPTCRGHREGSQGRDAVMLVVVAHARRLSLRRPGAPARGDEQQAALIQEGEMGPKSLGFFLSPATGSAANGQWLSRGVGWAAAPAPDSSSPDGVRSSRHGQGESGCQTPP